MNRIITALLLFVGILSALCAQQVWDTVSGTVHTVAAAAMPAPMAGQAVRTPLLPHCAQEDGSGTTAPCVWDPRVDGNGKGSGPVTFYIPQCSVYEQELAEQAAAHGYTLHLACINPTDGAN